MDVAGEDLATNALRGQFIMTEKLKALLENVQKEEPWQGKWNNPGNLTEEEHAELIERISEKIDSEKLRGFLSALEGATLNQTDKETILLILPPALDIIS